ncbi:hypothetical protein [Enterobacter sp. JBIWA003]|uniref:hypothetical protein n=1 Tax=Enterobacter sp. JBIWA003 TaxID=2831890 RepID=UPI001CC15AFB|nr:hypothetical protein [Enterobacter sp. JBIWA003]
MANLPETPQWEDGIYQIEVSDPVLGGPDGISNRQAKQLAKRTSYLKQQVEKGGTDLAAHIAAADPHTQYAPKASPTFTGTPTAPTPANSDNSKKLATTEFVAKALAALAGSAPETLDTLKELADALGNDPNFATTVLNKLAEKLAKDQNGADIPDPVLFVKNLGLGDSGGFVGRLLAPPMRLTASGVYNPSPEAKYALVELQAAGGNGGNAPATGSGVVGIAVGGSAGGYAKFLVKISDITNFNYTVGVHASTSNSATAGGSTSFCGITCAGGTGSTLAGTSSGSSPVQSRGLLGGNVTNAGTTPLTLIESTQGDTSGNALYTSPGNSVSGNGAPSRFAPGPIGIGGSSGNGINAKDGAGGSGANSTNNPGGGFTGGLGGDGLMILWELA